MSSNLNFEAESFSAYQPPQSENYEQLEQEHHHLHAFHGGGNMFSRSRHGFGRGSWWRRHRSGSGDSTQDQQSIGWAQNCLAQITGAQVPQSGRMGPSTRRAIRKFQMQNQLPPTGRLDQNTMSALQQACGDQDGGGDQGDGDNETRYSAYEFDQAPLPTAPPPAYTPRNCNNDKLPSPSAVNRALDGGRVQCPTRANAQRMLVPIIKKAVAMLDHTIAELTHARESACRGEPLGYPNLREVTACWLKYKLGVCIDDPAAWTAGTFSSRSVAEVIRRLVRPRDLLASNEIVYICEPTCKKPTTIAWTHVAHKDKDGKWHCIPGTPDRKIHLCPPFWTGAQAPFRALTIIHEAVHLTHCAPGDEDEQTGVSIGSPECLAQFVAATNLQDLDPEFVTNCGFTNRCGTVPRQQIPRNCGAKTHPAPAPLPDWRPRR
jgi:peptidoglycan hydrolase-like protein with peptidoglycan-binding domain